MCLNRIVELAKVTVLAGTLVTGNCLFAQETGTKVQDAPFQKLPLTGMVTDATTKKAIVGASVSVNGFSAVITDDKGAFTINVPSYTADITISAEGYGMKQIALKERKTINVSLQDASLPTY